MVKKGVRDYQLYIEDILEAIGKIFSYTKGMSFKEFAKDKKTIDAVIRNFEVIGEAAKQLPDKIKNRYPEIEWRAMGDFRNVIIHEYFGIDLEIMWNIIGVKLVSLRKAIKKIKL